MISHVRMMKGGRLKLGCNALLMGEEMRVMRPKTRNEIWVMRINCYAQCLIESCNDVAVAACGHCLLKEDS